MKQLDMNALIEETVVLIGADVTVRNNILRTEFNPDLPLILGDKIQLQQVLLNLISNSFDAMEHTLNPHVMKIRTMIDGNNGIRVEVEDSGCGIPKENINKLFLHFFTSKPDGLGMGLSISRSIVEEHGGRLDLLNHQGQGATFFFTMPILAKDQRG